MSPEEKQKLVASWDGWWHSIDLGDGVVSPGKEGDTTVKKREALGLKPEMFQGKNVLDIGAYDGYFSFMAESWGAAKVTAIDIELSKGFEIAKKILNSKVEHVVEDLIFATPEKLGTFDVVMCFGVLYHMKFPFYSLHRVANLTNLKGNLILETHSTGEEVDDAMSTALSDVDGHHQEATDNHFPTMLFYPDDELNGDPTNWWGPSIECTASMIEKVGFEVNRIVYSSTPDRYTFHSTKIGGKLDITGHSYCPEVRKKLER